MSFHVQKPATTDKPALYRQLCGQLSGLLAGEADPWANMANAAALIHAMLPDLNWTGFYLLRGGELVVGPFQGLPACVRIPLGRGVCGTAAATRQVQVVADVHAFEGHIACDAASNSEVVVPLVRSERLIGVLDLDSPALARFDAEDAAGLESAAAIIVAACDWTRAGIDAC